MPKKGQTSCHLLLNSRREFFNFYSTQFICIYSSETLGSHCSKSSIFVQKFNLISRENCRFFGVKNSWKCCGFGLFSFWQLWFHEKNCQKKKIGWKTHENVWVLSRLNFDISNSVKFLARKFKLDLWQSFSLNRIFMTNLGFWPRVYDQRYIWEGYCVVETIMPYGFHPFISWKKRRREKWQSSPIPSCLFL